MKLPEDQEFIDTLILEGALVISGVDDRGEIVYNITDKLKELAPELYDGFLQLIKDSVMSLWEKGFLDMDITQENPLVKPTELALDRAKWDRLTEGESETLNSLMRAFGGDF